MSFAGWQAACPPEVRNFKTRHLLDELMISKIIESKEIILIDPFFKDGIANLITRICDFLCQA